MIINPNIQSAPNPSGTSRPKSVFGGCSAPDLVNYEPTLARLHYNLISNNPDQGQPSANSEEIRYLFDRNSQTGAAALFTIGTFLYYTNLETDSLYLMGEYGYIGEHARDYHAYPDPHYLGKVDDLLSDITKKVHENSNPSTHKISETFQHQITRQDEEVHILDQRALMERMVKLYRRLNPQDQLTENALCRPE